VKDLRALSRELSFGRESLQNELLQNTQLFTKGIKAAHQKSAEAVRSCILLFRTRSLYASKLSSHLIARI